MELNIPDKIRGRIYVVLAFLSPTVFYLSETGRIGTAEVALFSAYASAAAMLARLNITPKQ